jgi:AcrR family transcriptional regulator
MLDEGLNDCVEIAPRFGLAVDPEQTLHVVMVHVQLLSIVSLYSIEYYSTHVKVPVKSHPTVRAEQAARTRRRILEAARVVFVETGFAAARIEDIAAHAGVAVPTVYKIYVNKRNLLAGALNLALTGEGGNRIDQQAWFTEQLAASDPVDQLSLIARNARQLYERSSALLAVLDAAAPGDDELQILRDDFAAQRVARSQRTARSLLGKLGKRLRLSRADTALTLLSLTDPALFNAFIATGATPGKYEQWLSDVLTRTLVR